MSSAESSLPEYESFSSESGGEIEVFTAVSLTSLLSGSWMTFVQFRQLQPGPQECPHFLHPKR